MTYTNWYFLSLAVALCALAYYAFILMNTLRRSNQALQKLIPINPTTTIFAFDIHGVMFKPSITQIIQLVWHLENKLSFIAYLFKPSFWYDLALLVKRRAVAEEFIIGLAKKHPELKPYVPTGIAIANAQKPVNKTIAIIRELKAKGYQLHLLSNIGTTILEAFHKDFPDIFDLFDNVHVADEQENYMRKPHPAMYQRYLELRNPLNHTIIFIDDNLANIDAALNTGLVGIYFQSAEKLHSLLKKVNAL